MLNGVVIYWPTILSSSYKYTLPIIIDLDPPAFETKEVAEEIEMWKNAKISLVEMDEDGDMKDGIWA